MELIYTSEYCDIFLDKENALLEKIWKPATEFMPEHEFRKVMQDWKDTAINNHIKYNVLNTCDFLFTLSPEIQHWIASEIMTPAVEGGLQKMATILPEEDVFVQNSVEESMEENQQDVLLPTRYFDNIATAKRWLFHNEI